MEARAEGEQPYVPRALVHLNRKCIAAIPTDVRMYACRVLP